MSIERFEFRVESAWVRNGDRELTITVLHSDGKKTSYKQMYRNEDDFVPFFEYLMDGARYAFLEEIKQQREGEPVHQFATDVAAALANKARREEQAP